MGDARPVAEQAAVVIRIGTSGWSYDHWAPELYAAGLPAGHRLARYAAAFATAELNSSFYRWPRPAAFSSWRRKLPDSFRLSVKAPRGLTHGRRLYAPEAWLQRISAGWHELACMYLCPRSPSSGLLRCRFCLVALSLHGGKHGDSVDRDEQAVWQRDVGWCGAGWRWVGHEAGVDRVDGREVLDVGVEDGGLDQGRQ